MANIINANSNQNYFQFRGSHYKYQRGVPLGLPISRSTFKNFLQNLESKFIKSSSKSKALIHYPTGWPRRHWTPDLFISSYLHCTDLADPCGNPSRSSESFMHHQILCDLFHGIHGVQEMQVSEMITHNTELVHRLLWGVLKLVLHGHHGSGEGDVAQPQLIHWPVNDSLSNWHTLLGCNALEHCLTEMTPVT